MKAMVIGLNVSDLYDLGVCSSSTIATAIAESARKSDEWRLIEHYVAADATEPPRTRELDELLELYHRGELRSADDSEYLLIMVFDTYAYDAVLLQRA